MQKEAADIINMWEIMGRCIKGQGNIINQKEIEIDIVRKTGGSLTFKIFLRTNVLREIERIVIEETKKLYKKDDNGHDLSRYLARYGGIVFSDSNMEVDGSEKLYMLGYVFRQALCNMKKKRVASEKERIRQIFIASDKAKMPTSIFYKKGSFWVKIDGRVFCWMSR